jgi:TP901 family phage tail tape measure protein
MASKNIKGINIELGADTTGLSEAIRAAEKETSKLGTELKAIDRDLKLNPDSFILLTQKSELLGKEINSVSDKLKILKDAQTQVTSAFKSGEITGEQYRAFEREIERTTGFLDKLEQELTGLDGLMKSGGAASASMAADMGRAEKAVEKLSGAAADTGANVSMLGDVLIANLAADAITAGLRALADGLGTVITSAASAAIEFESAFAGVAKTVDAASAQLGGIRDEIRAMAREIPAAAAEIAGVAEAAGQLGIKTEAVTAFTRTMIDLGNSTNLSANEAADALARLANITQMPQTEFDRLGSTIAELGNNLATTESEIVGMAMRLAAAGNQIGLTQAQILAFAGALSSVGIEAEAGGSALSKVMLDIDIAAAEGEDAVAGFAAAAGLSAAEFTQAWKEDAAGALLAFVEGLGRLKSQGINTAAALEDLGLKETRVRDALLRAAGAGDLFRESLERGTKAWAENTALTAEASKRYETTASQIQILKNNIADMGLTLGEALLPGIQSAAEALSRFADENREELESLGNAIGAAFSFLADNGDFIAGVLGSIGAGLLGVSINAALAGTASTGLAGALGAVAAASAALLVNPVFLSFAGVTAAVAGTAAAVKHFKDAADDAEQALLHMGDTVKGLADNVNEISDRNDRIDALTARFKDLKSAVESGALSTEEAAAANEELKQVKQELIDLSDGMITANDLEKGTIDALSESLKNMTESERQLALARLEAALSTQNLDELMGKRDELQKAQDLMTAQLDTLPRLAAGLSGLAKEIELLNGKRNEGLITEEEYGRVQAELIDRANELGETVYTLDSGFLRISEDAADAGAAFEDLAEKIDANGEKLKTAEANIKTFNEQQKQYAQWTSKTADATEKNAAAQEAAVKAAAARKAAEEEELNLLRRQTQSLNDAAAELRSLTDNTNDLESAYDKLSQKQALTRDELLNLIDTYPQLAEYIARNNDAVLLNGQIIQEVMQGSREAAIARAKDEAEKTTVTVNNAKARIRALQAELDALTAVYRVHANAPGLGEALEETQKQQAQMQAALKDAEAAQTKAAAALVIMEQTGAAAAKSGAQAAESGTKAAKEQNEALEEQLAILEHRKKMGEVNTRQETTELERIRQAYAQSAKEKESLDEKLYELRKTLRERELDEQTAALEHSKKMGEADTRREIEELERIKSAYAETAAENESIDERLYALRKELGETEYKEASARIKSEADERMAAGARSIALQKQMNGLRQADGRSPAGSSVFSFTAADEIKALSGRMELAAQLYENLLALAEAGNKMTDEQKKDLEDAQKQMQAYSEQIEDVSLSAAKELSDADNRLIALNQKLFSELDKANQAYYKAAAAIQSKLGADMLKAERDFDAKVKALQDKREAGEKQITQAYEDELDKRAKSLMNFTGLFNAVTKKDVSGQQLLTNLQDQLDAVKDWREQLDQLTEKGLDASLLKELADMGPGAASELAALNTLTEDELAQYAQIYREKAELARKLAVSEMEDQRTQMREQLEQLRADTAAEMDTLTTEYQTKLAELNAASEEELLKLEDAWHESLTKINADTEEQMKTLTQTVQNAFNAVNLSEGIEHMGADVKAVIQAARKAASALADPNVKPEVLVEVTADFSDIETANAEALAAVEQTEPDWKKEGNRLVSAARDGVKQTRPELTNETQRLGAAAVDALAAGMRDNARAALSEAERIADRIIDVFRDAMQIKLPETLMDSVGRFAAAAYGTYAGGAAYAGSETASAPYAGASLFSVHDAAPVIERAAARLGLARETYANEYAASAAATGARSAAGLYKRGAGRSPAGGGEETTAASDVYITNNIEVASLKDLPYQLDRANQRALRGLKNVRLELAY